MRQESQVDRPAELLVDPLMDPLIALVRITSLQRTTDCARMGNPMDASRATKASLMPATTQRAEMQTCIVSVVGKSIQ